MLALARALTLASHSAFTFGGTTFESQCPSHLMPTLGSFAVQLARTAPLQSAEPPLSVHSPLQLPLHSRPASSSTSQLPVHLPLQLPAHCALPEASLTYAEQPASHEPLQVPLHSAAASSFTSQVPLHWPMHMTV